MSARSPVRDGGTLRVRLLAMVVLPLVGCAALAFTRIETSLSSARSASLADAHLRSAVAVDLVRAAFEQEVLPALTAASVRNPAPTNAAPTPADLQAAAAIVKQLPQLRSATDRAVAGLAGQPSVRADVPSFLAGLAAARADIDNPVVLSNALAGATTFTNLLAVVSDAQVAEAAGSGLNPAAAKALKDVAVVARAIRSASEEFPLYIGTQFASAVSPLVQGQRWARGWAGYEAASAAVSTQTSGAIATQWDAVNATAAVGAFNQFLTAQLVPDAPGVVSTAAIVAMIEQDGARNKADMGVLSAALDSALVAGADQHRNAEDQLAWIVATALLVLAVSGAVSVWVRRSVTRPLARLAAVATRISQGELTDVAVSGPHEVRVVARALSSSVASLRTIEAHAAAVASGDFDSRALREVLPGALGEVVHASGARIIDAINAREAAQHELVHRAAHDGLTELPNRAQALALIGKALHRGRRASHTTALMFIDLDYFKAVNDTFGHAAGDEVLQIVARRVTQVVRDGDSVARLGGDEFVVLVEDIQDEADVVSLAERVVAEVSTEMIVDHRTIRIGASVGVALCRDGYVDADRLLQEADAAAYRAKNSGRGRVDVFDDGLRAELRERAGMELAITAGLDRSEFILYYQPIIDLCTGRIDSVEALIRWHRPGHGLLTPDQFVPVAARSTLINDIGRWVLHEATAQLARWQLDPGMAGLRMAVNISGRHLASPQLVTDVIDALADSAIDPHQLTLEMAESVLVDDLAATQNLQTLRDLGVQVAIDDFGTGFTSIAQLPRLHVDTLKIDRSFVASPDPTQQELTRLIVASAHAFGLTVIAEGIEHQDQADHVHTAGAEYGQGFLYAGPQLPADLFPRICSPSRQPGG